MTVWILDDGPLGLLARRYNPAWSWPSRSLHTLAEVASAAPLDKSGRRNSLLGMNQSGEPVIEVHSIMAGSPAARFLFEYLRPRASGATKNLGEDAAISYCAFERTDACFVTMDKGAAFLALAELGTGRVATPFDLWHDLLTQELVSSAEFSSLARRSISRWDSRAFPSGSAVDSRPIEVAPPSVHATCRPLETPTETYSLTLPKELLEDRPMRQSPQCSARRVYTPRAEQTNREAEAHARAERMDGAGIAQGSRRKHAGECRVCRPRARSARSSSSPEHSRQIASSHRCHRDIRETDTFCSPHNQIRAVPYLLLRT